MTTPLYTSNVSESAWALIEPILSGFGHRKDNRTHSLQAIFNAICYVVDNGVKWRSLPNDFPPWKTVYHYFRKWSLEGLIDQINQLLVETVRAFSGREKTPSLASIDSQSQTGEPGISCRGIDGGKKVNGRKRSIAVDAMGLILECHIASANTSDSVGGNELVTSLNNKNIYPRMAKVLGDSAYRCVGKDLPVAVTVEAKERKEGQKGFVPEAFRWAVERTFAWLNRQRRLARNYEKSITHQRTMTLLGNIKLCAKRIEALG